MAKKKDKAEETPQDEPTVEPEEAAEAEAESEPDEATEVAAAPAEDAPAPVEAEAEAEQPAAEAEAEAEEEQPEPAAPPETEETTVAEEAGAAEAEAEAPAEAEKAEGAPAAEAEAEAPAEAEEEEAPAEPRARPEIPGADLEVDIVREGEDPLASEELDEEALAAAEAEAEADQPIAEAAIDLAASARYRATGKRKTAIARVTLKPGDGTYTINGKPLDAYFPRATLQRGIRQPLETVGYDDRMDVIARMDGGGVSAQAGALRHGISRALLEADPNLRGELKRRGFLTRDARAKERKKAGLKKARKRPQFSKR